ncbi:MAG: L-glyceraldehyde 3-phosphate reductase [Bacteroidales bacterium]|nr:L-glyceraldehyde 3-phosphate reductase [Bacteroidales bacterium]
MDYTPSSQRYNEMLYRRCGRSGLKLPAISLGLWHNFGANDDFANSRNMLRSAFDLGICHFDLANNYGIPAGSAEITFGKALKQDFAAHRDELIISTKAGWDMWPGPYGNFGSRKYLIASLDQSLKRMGLDYVDIFYHHRPDPETPLEETMGALAHLVHAGKALYAGISQYSPEQTRKASDILRSLGVPLLIHQPRYNMFDRWIEPELLNVLEKEGAGCIVFSPQAQGLLSSRYLKGFPADSRAVKDGRFLSQKNITEEKLKKIHCLNKLALERKQSLAQMAVAWALRKPQVTSALIGASHADQIDDVAGVVKNMSFTENEISSIENILSGQ